MAELKNKISILKDGEYNVYPVTAAKIVYLEENVNEQREFNSLAITPEPFIEDENLNISIEDKDAIFAYITKLSNEVQELKKEIEYLKK